MKSYTRIRARIDLDAIEYNIEKMKENLPEDTKLIVVAKADCYGHGALQTTSLLSLKEYVWGFAVATLDEVYRASKRRNYKADPCTWLYFP